MQAVLLAVHFSQGFSKEQVIFLTEQRSHLNSDTESVVTVDCSSCSEIKNNEDREIDCGDDMLCIPPEALVIPSPSPGSCNKVATLSFLGR